VRRRTSGRAGWPPPELLSFDLADWPDEQPTPSVGEGRLPGWLVRQMRQWSAWCAARERWEAEHGDWWPTGAVERWAEEHQARPGGSTRSTQAAGGDL
jgi:hypothetical protein